MTVPRLFGITHSNRDFSTPETWGENQFNSSFPMALCAYFREKKMMANYITLDKNFEIYVNMVSIDSILNIESLCENDIFYSFETSFSPYNIYIKGQLPRTDIVLQNIHTKESLSCLEIKLTALPDQTTFDKKESDYGSEIVVRPDTIIYLACSLLEAATKNQISLDVFQNIQIDDWEDSGALLENADKIFEIISSIITKLSCFETPILLQPIWKTMGKSPILSDDCLDIFAWSNVAFLRFIYDISKDVLKVKNPKITRPYRTIIWICKMVFDYQKNHSFDHQAIIDKLSYNVKNDKAFACSGNITNLYMKCQNLLKPRISKHEIKNIILGGGQNLLSPERRFDAIICNSLDLFA